MCLLRTFELNDLIENDTVTYCYVMVIIRYITYPTEEQRWTERYRERNTDKRRSKEFN